MRRPKILALNDTWVMSDSSVLGLRFGMTRFPDNNTLSVPFDPSTLGFSQTYLDQITLEKFPGVRIRGYDQFASQTLGAINPTQINWKSTSANATWSKFVGRHTFKVGGDFRQIGVDSYIPGDGAGFFDFDKDMTSSNGGTGSTTDGNAFASFLLGYPSTVRTSQISVSTPLDLYAYYYGGYVQDDWRVNSKLTLNYGLRIEHEDGLREAENRFTVGFDPAMSSALSSITIPADPIAGTPARTVSGGLMYAGVDGNKTTQGNAPAVKWSPRLSAAYALDEQTVLRGGYGLYWAPFNYPSPSTSASNYGQVGYTQNTILSQSRTNPVTLTNPFPNGVAAPTGNSLGALTNLDSNISFVDQNRTAPRVQQFSVDLQRELGADLTLTASYVGARSDHLGLGGSNDTPININQLDPAYLALGAALNDPAPEPVPRQPERAAVAVDAGDAAALAAAAALPAVPPGQRPPGDRRLQPLQRRGVRVSQRLKKGWGGRFSYTYSVLKDNQVGETNFYAAVSPALPVNNYNYLATRAGVRGGHAVHHRLLRPGRRIRLQRPRRAAPRDPRADGGAAVRRGPPLRQQRVEREAARRLDGRGDDHAAERLPAERAAGRRRAPQPGRRDDGEPAEHRRRRRPRHRRRLRGSPRLGRSSDRDLGQPGGVHAGARRHLRQRAAHDYRGANAGAVQRRRRGAEGHRPDRRVEGPGPARSAERAEPPERPRAAGRQHGRQLELRPDQPAVRLHADPAVLLQDVVLGGTNHSGVDIARLRSRRRQQASPGTHAVHGRVARADAGAASSASIAGTASSISAIVPSETHVAW